MKPGRLILAALLLCAIATTTFAKSPTGRGKYRDWGPSIDSVEIVSTFDASDYGAIVIGDFATGSVKLPARGDNSYEAVRDALQSVESHLVEGAKAESKKRVARGSAKGKALLVRGRVREMEPGSRAGRYWSGGLGGGAAAVEISGEIVDAGSGKVLVRFTQRRKSGGGMRIGGGSYSAVLNACVRAIGEDIAHIVDQF